MLKVSVVIVCYKRFKHFEDILYKWLQQTDDVIVVDNSGKFKTELPVTVFNINKNLGPQARYPFSFFAKYKWVIYADDDIMPMPGLIKDLWKYRHKNKIVSIIGRIFNGRSYYTSTGYRGENISGPIKVDWIGGGCTLSPIWNGAVHVPSCPWMGVDDFWWEHQLDGVSFWVVPSKNYKFTDEYKDKHSLHTTAKTREMREKYYKEWTCA